MKNFRKNIYTKSFLVMLLLLLTCKTNAQEQFEKALIGTWEIQGTLMGDNGEGWLAPHKQADASCEPDHSLFSEDYQAKEVRYGKGCVAKENNFSWKLEGNVLTLSKGERKINWLIHSIEGDKMIVGVQARPGAKNRMYLEYKKR